jgi:hypothetical protein
VPPAAPAPGALRPHAPCSCRCLLQCCAAQLQLPRALLQGCLGPAVPPAAHVPGKDGARGFSSIQHQSAWPAAGAHRQHCSSSQLKQLTIAAPPGHRRAAVLHVQAKRPSLPSRRHCTRQPGPAQQLASCLASQPGLAASIEPLSAPQAVVHQAVCPPSFTTINPACGLTELPGRLDRAWSKVLIKLPGLEYELCARSQPVTNHHGKTSDPDHA